MSDKYRGSRHDRGYGSEWDKLRLQILKRDGYQCQECKRQGRVTAAQDVDHIKRKKDEGTDDPSNLQSLCRPCHIAKTAAEKAKMQR
jgi:5-methylcytosine-specific restriction protein A